ncbi:MAG: hypothetical protein ACPG77_06875, partial [Nannocystaceae bacterium]
MAGGGGAASSASNMFKMLAASSGAIIASSLAFGGLVIAFGILATLVGGVAAYIIENWKDISKAIIKGLDDGTISLVPLLTSLYTLWARLTMVGETVLGGSDHVSKFNGLLNVLIAIIDAVSGSVAFFMKAMAYSMRIWGALKMAFLGVLLSVAALMAGLSKMGLIDTPIERINANVESFMSGTQDTFRAADELLERARMIEDFEFSPVDLEKINKDAAKMEKSLKDMLAGLGGNGKKTNRARVNVQKVEVTFDMRDTDPDRLMGAFVKPLQRLADTRTQSYSAVEGAV